MTRGPVASLLALVAWLVLAVLWLAWTVLLAVAWLGAQTKRGRRKVERAYVRFPRPARILARLPGRPRPAQARRASQGFEPQRMSSRQRAELVAVCADRDGLVCQECGARLDPTVHHRHPLHPELHHLLSWSRHKHEPWVDHPVNLVLLCQPCHGPLGADGITPTLRAKRAALWRHYRFDQPGRAA